MFKVRKEGIKLDSAVNYEMPRYIKIELGTIFSDILVYSILKCDELSDMIYEENNEEAKKFAIRFHPDYPECLLKEKEDAKDAKKKKSSKEKKKDKLLMQIDKPDGEDRQMIYISSENGYIYLIELNKLIDHLEIKKSKGISQMNNYDPMKKVLKNKNDVFSTSKDVEDYFEDKRIISNRMNEFKMDKTFHLTQEYTEETKLVIDMSSKLLYKLKFKVHHESLTLVKVLSMPNKVLIT